MSHKSHDENVAREFDRTADSYDQSRLVKSYQRRTQLLVINKMKLKRGMNILDLGCGTGQGAIDIASQLQGTGEVVGLDVSEKMIEKAKNKLDTLPHQNVVFRVGSGNSLDYEGYFDYVLSTNAFHHFDRKEEIFTRVLRSLKQDGIFIIQDFCRDFLLMRIADIAGKIGEKAHVGTTTAEGLKQLFLATGFTDVQVEKIKLNWYWGIMIGQGRPK